MRLKFLSASHVLFLIASLFCLLPLYAKLPQTAFDLDGKSVDPIKASQGKVSVLVFVRTDCPISNRYAPLLQQLNETYSSKVKFWLVYPDKKTTAAEICEHLKQYRYTISALRDPGHVLVKLASATITPEAAVFDAHGQLLYHGRIDNLYEDPSRSRPSATTRELQSTLDAVISGKPAPFAASPSIGCYILTSNDRLR